MATTNPQKIRQLLQSNGLTKGQRNLLSGRLSVATTKTALASSVNAKRQINVDQMLQREIVALRSLVVSNLPDHRGTAAYRSQWLHAGMPQDHPAPLPILSSAVAGLRCATVRLNTQPMVMTVPASGDGLVKVDPYRIVGQLRGYTGVQATANIPTSANLDTTMATAATSSAAIFNPMRSFFDEDNIKNETNGEIWPLAAQQRPPYVQVMGVIIDVAVAVPYTGSCITTPHSPGNAGSLLGWSSPVETFDIDQANAAYHTPPALLPHRRIPIHVSAAISPSDFARRHVVPTIQMGGSSTASKCYRVYGCPDTHWVKAGVHDATDAPDAAQTSYDAGLSPRDNFAHTIQHGYVAIRNTAAVDVTVVATATIVYAVLIDTDSHNTNVNPLVTMHRTDAAEEVRPLHPDMNFRSPSSVVGDSAEHIHRQVVAAARGNTIVKSVQDTSKATVPALANKGWFERASEAVSGAASFIGKGIQLITTIGAGAAVVASLFRSRGGRAVPAITAGGGAASQPSRGYTVEEVE